MANAVLTVADVYNDFGDVLGTQNSAIIYSKINDSVEILSTEGDWDPTRGYVDVCVGCNSQVTLPPLVDTVLAVNIGGRPTELQDFWFQFHLNGPGEYFKDIDNGWNWTTPTGRGDGGGKSGNSYDGLVVSVFRDPPGSGTALVTQLESVADSGTPMRVYGFDANGNWIRSVENNLPVDGFLVPTVYGAPTANPTAPPIAVITRVSFENVTRAGYIGLWGFNSQGVQVQMGNYMPTELEPRYRRIQLSRSCGVVRIAYKKRVQPLSAMTDIINLHSKWALVLMAMSLKKLSQDRIQEAEAYQQKAVNFLIKKQKSVSVPSGPSVQIADKNLLADKQDRMD